MNEQHKKNKRTILIIFGMSIIPFGIAWYLASNPGVMGEGTNNGKLITPPVTTEFTEFEAYDDFSSENMKEIKGHWVLVNIMPNTNCNKICQKAIHKTKQLRLMMSKDLTRIRRLVLIIPEISTEISKNWWKDDARLLKSKPTVSSVKKLEEIRQTGIPEGMLFLMDPFGNLMMQYEPEFDPYKVKRDLKKLLKISQIG